MKSTLRFLIPTLLVAAACGGGGGGDDTSGDDGPGLTCAMATTTIAGVGMTTGTVKGAGADITAAKGSCAEEPFYGDTGPDGEDTVVELTGLTAGKHYGVTLTATSEDDDLGFYITTACPMGGDVTSCAVFEDAANAGSDEIATFTPTASSAFVVVDYSTEYNTDPTMFDGGFTLKVVEAECTTETVATDCDAATPICGDDFKCHQCGSDADCSGATPKCGTDFTCKAGPALCVNDDAGDSGNGDDAINVAQTIAAPTAGTPTTVTNRICSSDATEVDWYKVTLAANVGIQLTMDPTVDLDLYLYDADGRSVDQSENDALGATEQILTTDIDASATYYIVVHQYAPANKTATTPYTLRLNVPTCDPDMFNQCTTAAAPVCGGTGECAAGPNLCVGDDLGDTTSGGDDGPAGARALITAVPTTASICSSPDTEADYYKFTVTDGQGATVSLNWTGAVDLDVAVKDSTGKTYGNSFWKQPEVVTLTNLPGGTYYVVVSNFEDATTTSTAYTITETTTPVVQCTNAASCAAEYKTQVFRGSCNPTSDVCSFLPAGGGASGAFCDTSASCGATLECSNLPFESGADKSKCVPSDGCMTDADCSGIAGTKCTVGYVLNLGFATIDLNKCVQACATDTDCGANTGDGTLDTNQPWNYNKCAPATGVCTQDDGA